MCFVFTSIVQAQTTDYNNALSSSIDKNPSFAGIFVCPNVFSSYKISNNSFFQGYSSQIASFDMFVPKMNADIGVSVVNHTQSRYFVETVFNGVYAKEFQIKKGIILKTGLSLGLGSFHAINGGLVYYDMLDPLKGEIYKTQEPVFVNSKVYLDADYGCLLYTNKFYSGFSFKHINSIFTKNDTYIINIPEVSLHGLYNFSNSKGFTQKSSFNLLPTYNVTYSRINSYMQVGLYFKRFEYVLGIAFKQNFTNKNETLSIFVGIVEKKFKFAYNCDVAINSEISEGFNGQEFSVSYKFDCNDKQKRFKGVKAPIVY
jgi:type IX secretion system PorP/SprF family membrane protein